MRLSTSVALAAALTLGTAAHAFDFDIVADLDQPVGAETASITEHRAHAEGYDPLGGSSAEFATLSFDEVEAALDPRNFVQTAEGSELVTVADTSIDPVEITGSLGRPVSPSDAIVSFDSELLP